MTTDERDHPRHPRLGRCSRGRLPGLRFHRHRGRHRCARHHHRGGRNLAAETWQKVLTRDDASTRRTPGRWSDLEYAAHMRDVLDLFRRRTELMLTETDPTLDNFDGDAVAIASDYEHQNPAE